MAIVSIIENRAGNPYNRYPHMLKDGAGKIFKIYTKVDNQGWLIENEGKVVAQWDTWSGDKRIEHASMLQDGADCLVICMYVETGWPVWGDKTFNVKGILTAYSGEPAPTPTPTPTTQIKGPIEIIGRVVITPE